MKGVKLFLGLFILVSFMNLGSSLFLGNMNCENALEYKDRIVGQSVPEQAPFKSEVINLYISEEPFGHVALEEKKIKDLSCLKNENYDYEVYFKDTETITKLLESEDTLETYKELKKSGDIEVKAKGLGKKVKLGFINFILKFF